MRAHGMGWRWRTVFVAILALGCMLAEAAVPARAQSVTGPITPVPGQNVQLPQQQAPIRVNVALVNTPVVVKNDKGDLMLDLTEKNFRVFDNGVEEHIVNFDMGSEPITAVIVMETSSRIAPLLPAVRRTGVLFTQNVLGDGGEAAVIGYNDDVDTLQPMTSNADAIEKAISNLQAKGSGLRLYDALAKALDILEKAPAARRRVIITVAEALDSGSEAKLGEILRQAQLADITIYPIGLSTTSAELRTPTQAAGVQTSPPGTFTTPPFPGQAQTPDTQALYTGNADLGALVVWLVQHTEGVVRERPLEVAATGTGGLYQSSLKDKDLEPAIDEIGGELHAQYTISYRPSGTSPGGYHEIRVQVVDAGPGLKVRTRPGYYLGQPQG